MGVSTPGLHPGSPARSVWRLRDSPCMGSLGHPPFPRGHTPAEAPQSESQRQGGWLELLEVQSHCLEYASHPSVVNTKRPQLYVPGKSPAKIHDAAVEQRGSCLPSPGGPSLRFWWKLCNQPVPRSTSPQMDAGHSRGSLAPPSSPREEEVLCGQVSDASLRCHAGICSRGGYGRGKREACGSDAPDPGGSTQRFPGIMGREGATYL